MLRRILTGTVIATVVAGVGGVAWAATAGTYSGNTSQKQGSIALTVKSGVVTRVKFVDGNGVGSGCQAAGAGNVLPQFPVTFKAHFKITRGKFSGKASPRSEEVFKISGTFKGQKVSGSFTDSIPIAQETTHGFTCRSGTVKYTATTH
jgi:hypothetical protein